MINVLTKKKFEELDEVDTEGSWAISYGDLVTLLLTFFILFFSINKKDEVRDNKRVQLRVALIETLKGKSNIAEDVGVDKKIDVGDKKEKGIDLSIIKKWNGVAHEKGNHIIIEFPMVSFFNSGKVYLTEDGKKALNDFVNVYMPYAAHYKVSILAFTDTKKVKMKKIRKFDDNLELSALRSIAAMRELQKAGIPLSKMKLGGYGEKIMTAKELTEIMQQRAAAESLDSESRSLASLDPSSPLSPSLAGPQQGLTSLNPVTQLLSGQLLTNQLLVTPISATDKNKEVAQKKNFSDKQDLKPAPLTIKQHKRLEQEKIKQALTKKKTLKEELSLSRKIVVLIEPEETL